MTDFLTIIPNWLPGWLGAGAAAGGGFGVIKWTAEFFAGRIDKRASAIDAGTLFLIDNLRAEVARLAERVETVETDLAECHKLHAAAEARVMQLEATQRGLGDARAHAQLIIAAEKSEQRGSRNGHDR